MCGTCGGKKSGCGTGCNTGSNTGCNTGCGSRKGGYGGGYNGGSCSCNGGRKGGCCSQNRSNCNFPAPRCATDNRGCDATDCCGNLLGLRTASLNISSSYQCDRTIAFAVVDDQLVNPCLEPLFWRVEHIPAGCTFSVQTKITGEFAVRVSPVGECGVSYTTQRCNRLGTTTVVSDSPYSGLLLSNPLPSSVGNRNDVRVVNNSCEPVQVTVGLISCTGCFEPILRCRELAPCGEMVAMFPCPRLAAFFVDPSTQQYCPVSGSGEFASSALFVPQKSSNSLYLSDESGWPRFHQTSTC